MTWPRLRLWLILMGLSLTAFGLLPVLLIVVAWQVGGFLGGMAFLGGVLLSPMLLLSRLGIFVLQAAWKGQQVVMMGRQWGPPEEHVIDAEFEQR